MNGIASPPPLRLSGKWRRQIGCRSRRGRRPYGALGCLTDTPPIDDSPTKRYGPHVEGAGIHHNPTPGPADAKFLYGHVWVTLAWLARHRAWATIAVPVFAKLYIRVKDLIKRTAALAVSCNPLDS